ncbi:MAG TPA: divalent-cation tolerance protein CutA [Terriglobales bacterium]|nr:divalent-cation tolerance protein CutA [Terriglobales bacterium]
MTEKRIVLTTIGSKEAAQKMAQALVTRHLAACVNIVGPVESVYWWKGKVESAGEYVLLIKTMADSLDNLYKAVRELHTYELAEFAVLTVESGSREYLQWIEGCVR